MRDVFSACRIRGRVRIFANLQNASNMELPNVLYVSSRFSNAELRICEMFFRMWNPRICELFFSACMLDVLECGIANMDMFSQKIYKKFFECGIANLLDVRMRNWRDIPNLEFVWTCIRIWNSHFLYVLSVELANMPDVFEYRTRKSRIPM